MKKIKPYHGLEIIERLHEKYQSHIGIENNLVDAYIRLGYHDNALNKIKEVSQNRDIKKYIKFLNWYYADKKINQPKNNKIKSAFGRNKILYQKNKESDLNIQAQVAESWRILIKAYFHGELNKFSLKPKKFFESEKIIWQYWGQGLDEETLPEVVKLCFSSVDFYKEDYTVIRLCDGNVDEYLDFPNFVYKKRINPQFNHTHFSDLLRIALLNTYGGIWMDARMLLTAPIPEDIKNKDFFLFHRDNNVSHHTKEKFQKYNYSYFDWNNEHHVNILNGFLVSDKEHYITGLCLDLMLNFWETQNQIPHYFFFQILFDVLSKEYINDWKSRKVYDDIPIHLLQYHIKEKYNKNIFENITNIISIHSLSKDNDGMKDSYYEHLLKMFSKKNKLTSKKQYSFENKYDVSVVTAFFDIGRGNWREKNNLKRSNSDYFNYFSNLAKLENEMIVFVSKEHQDIVLNMRENRKTKIVSFDFFNEFDKFRNKISEIQNMENFKSQVNILQAHNPEYWSADYVLINNLKHFFVNQAINKKLISNEMVAWLDFGCCRSDSILNNTKVYSKDSSNPKFHWRCTLDKNKFHLFSVNYDYKNIVDFDSVLTYMLNNKVSLIGTYLVGSQKKWKEFGNLMCQYQTELLSKSIVDDDQGLLLMCYQRNKKLFQINHLGENQWFSFFDKFSFSPKNQNVQSLQNKFNDMAGKYCKHISIGNFVYSANISLKHNYIYIETPKVACSFIKSILIKMELEETDLYYKDIHKRNFSPLLNPKQVGNFDQLVQSSTLRFCFVRNPYTRLLSAYLDKIIRNKEQKRRVLMHLGLDSTNLEQEITFATFVEVVCEQPIINMDSHWRVQYYQTFQDNIEYDYIGRFENLNHDLPHILGRIRQDYQPFYAKETRHTTGANELLMQYYTPELIDKVKNKYQIDFEYFGYSTDITEA